MNSPSVVFLYLVLFIFLYRHTKSIYWASELVFHKICKYSLLYLSIVSNLWNEKDFVGIILKGVVKAYAANSEYRIFCQGNLD